MRRAFWTALGLGAGVAAAVLTSRFLRRQRERMSPAHVGSEVGGLARDTGRLVREAIAEGRRAMAEKEAEIRASLPE